MSIPLPRTNAERIADEAEAHRVEHAHTVVVGAGRWVCIVCDDVEAEEALVDQVAEEGHVVAVEEAEAERPRIAPTEPVHRGEFSTTRGFGGLDLDSWGFSTGWRLAEAKLHRANGVRAGTIPDGSRGWVAISRTDRETRDEAAVVAFLDRAELRELRDQLNEALEA